jgi:hypothetical protein
MIIILAIGAFIAWKSPIKKEFRDESMDGLFVTIQPSTNRTLEVP